MNLGQGTFLFFAAVAGGALNSVAGGGSFLCFPALVVTGMPPINANATNTAALWPGTAASVTAYRKAIAGHRQIFLPLVITGSIGGLIGSNLLLHTPQATFMRMVPWLMLLATLLLAFSRQVTAWVGTFTGADGVPTRKALVGGSIVQLCIALYIGFFGAGAGILMMALFAIMGVRSIHTINGLKTMLGAICNGMALVTFIVARAIVWPQALLMLVGAVLGGYGGAWYAQKLSPRFVRWFAIGTGFAMTAYFFVRG
jgi:uncharacterized membrane protein YfcA